MRRKQYILEREAGRALSPFSPFRNDSMERGIDPMNAIATSTRNRRSLRAFIHTKMPWIVLSIVVALFLLVGVCMQRPSYRTSGFRDEYSSKKMSRQSRFVGEPCVSVRCVSLRDEELSSVELRSRARSFFIKRRKNVVRCERDPENDALFIFLDDESGFYITNPNLVPTPDSKTVIAYSETDGHPVKRHSAVLVNGTCAAVVHAEAKCAEKLLAGEPAGLRRYQILRAERAICAQAELARKGVVDTFDDSVFIRNIRENALFSP